MTSQEICYYAGLDVGGTTIKSILVDGTGNQVGEMVEVASQVKGGFEATFQQLSKALELLTEQVDATIASVKGIGLDVPAPSSDGVIWGQANLAANWVGQNIRDTFSKKVGIPVFMTNDGNAAAMGEYVTRHKHFGGLLLVAPGTGLGGGLVLPGGKIYEGNNGLALEVGHISVPFREKNGELPPCTCGLKGCTEAWISLVALRRRVEIELADPKWKDHPLNSGELSTEEKAFRLRDFAEKEDELAIQLFRQQGFIFGYAIADMVRMFDPGLVVIGGGLAEMDFRDRYMEWVKEGFAERAWPMNQKSPLDENELTTRFEWARGGDSAGALGMAFVAQEMFS